MTTVRLPESLYTDLEAEAEARDLSVSEYIRDVLRERENTQPNTLENTQANTGLQERVDDLAERLEAVEAAVADDSFNSPGTEAENGALSEGEPERMEHPAGSDETVMSGSIEPETGADTGAWPAIEDLPTLHYHDEPADDLEAAARGALEDLEIPGRGEATEAIRREAVMWAWNYLREYRSC